MKRLLFSIIIVLAACNAPAADSAATNAPATLPKFLDKDSRLFEMRTYHAAPGKLDALHARFRDVTNKLFAKHGMEMIGYWVPMNKDGQYESTLVYILAFPNRAARDKAWKDFAADPEWKTAKADSEKDGPLLTGRPESVFMTATDYSAIK